MRRHLTHSQAHQQGRAVVVEAPGPGQHHHRQPVAQGAWDGNYDLLMVQCRIVDSTEDAEQEEGHAHGEVVLVTVHRVRTVQRGVGHPQPSSTARVALSVCATARNEPSPKFSQ